MMAMHDSSGSLAVGVTNFGPIASANIEIRPLTVFVGPSNTGKSYLAMLIYALHRAITGADHPMARGHDLLSSRFGLPTWDNIESEIPSDFTSKIGTWVNRSFQNPIVQQSTTLDCEPIPTSFASMMDTLVWGSDEVKKLFKDEISRCFGVDTVSSLVRRRSSKKSQIEIRTTAFGEEEMLRINLDIVNSSLAVRGKTSTSTPIDFPSFSRDFKRTSMYLRRINESTTPASNDSLDFAPKADNMSRTSRAFWTASELVVPRLLGELFRKAHYLPADRAGIIHAHRVVVSALIEAATAAGLLDTRSSPILSGVHSDFLQTLIRIGSSRSSARGRGGSVVEGNRVPKGQLGRMIEERMLGGTIQIEQLPRGYPEFMYRPTGWKEVFPLMNTSSMVSELAPIILYLRHIVRKGDILIIEEPESHLHPAMQAVLAKILAELVGEGIRIIVTTHSDWFLDQIGNLVRLSGVSEGDRERITDGVALEESDVGAWLFEGFGADGGSRVTEIKVDPDTGLYPVDYGRVSDSLYNESAMIFNQMQRNSGDD